MFVRTGATDLSIFCLMLSNSCALLFVILSNVNKKHLKSINSVDSAFYLSQVLIKLLLLLNVLRKLKYFAIVS